MAVPALAAFGRAGVTSMPFVLRDNGVGRRVSVRRVVGRDATGAIAFGDVVGDLLELTAEDALIEARSGLVRVPLAHIAASREVYPSTGDILALEAICARGWRAAETADVDGWLLRADGGFTGRANSVLPLGRPASLPDTIAAAASWYAERGLPLKLQSPLPARGLLDSELVDLGWDADDEVHVLARRLDQALLADSSHVVEIAAAPDAQWLAAYHYRGQASLPTGAAALLGRHDRAAFASIRSGGTTVAIARGAVDDGWLGVTAVEVEPAQRRAGMARALMAALSGWAQREHGATRSYLQVAAGNQIAITMYLGLGYWHHHDYRYLTAPI